MAEKKPEGKPWKRRNVVVDRHWQTGVAARLAFSAVAVAAVAQLATMFLLTSESADDLSSDEWRVAAIAVAVLQLLVLFGALWSTALRVTHAVAGPARVLELAVDNLCKDKFDSRLKLRDGDYLKELAAALERLTQKLEAQHRQQHGTTAPTDPAGAAPPREEDALV